MSRTPHCSSHCASCGRHFSSVGAFDRHRRGDIDDRRCESPVDQFKDGRAVFAALTEHGRCVIYPDAPRDDVTVWTLRAGLEAARERWGTAA